MAKKRSRKASRAPRGNMGSFTTVRGHNIFTSTSIVSGSSQFTLGLHPRLIQSNRATSYADMFETFRWDSFKIHFCLAGSGSNIGVSYAPGFVLDSAPINFASLTETDHFAMSYPGLTTPRVLTIQRSDLKGQIDWYDTTSTASTLPGFLTVSVLSSGTNLAVAQVFLLYFEWQMTLYGPQNPALTMLRLKEKVIRELEDEYEKPDVDEPPPTLCRENKLALNTKIVASSRRSGPVT